jgi:hypothetical protein
MRIYLPWHNLGTLGIRLGSHFYVDFFVDWARRVVMFYHIGDRVGYIGK